jgi:2-polyprenyl-3-methyl-5-hydroxy-6-metoxy-1,4-benzoquinol methylase
MISIEDQIREFYGKLKFPGPYQKSDFDVYGEEMLNPFLRPYDLAAQNARRILDIGCGSGFISNLLAYRHPDCQIDAVDFSDSLDYARDFANQAGLQNINHFKQNFLKFVAPYKYDVIISNGVLHHMPDYLSAVKQIDQILKPNGTLVVGLYNPWGKMAKRLGPPRYTNDILYQDQELVPFELTFCRSQVMTLFNNYELANVYPGLGKQFVDFLNLFNYNNGGLTIYTFRKNLIL